MIKTYKKLFSNLKGLKKLIINKNNNGAFSFLNKNINKELTVAQQ
jgi:hypothetical protein